MQAQNVASRPLAHFHVCIQCGSAFRREVFEGRSLTSGVFACPRCGAEGPLNIEIREVNETANGFQPALQKSQLVNGNGL
jgi:predicted RNA-binding Zn-ribbon protein involved in translation (DUF1610 family)